jgi:hypothetical protein
MAAHRADNDTANNLRNYTTPRDSCGPRIGWTLQDTYFARYIGDREGQR